MSIEPGWFRHSLRLDVRLTRCETCGKASRSSRLFAVYAHSSMTLTSRAYRLLPLATWEGIASTLPLYTFTHEDTQPFCHRQACLAEAETSGLFCNEDASGSEAAWAEALRSEAERTRRAAFAVPAPPPVADYSIL